MEANAELLMRTNATRREAKETMMLLAHWWKMNLHTARFACLQMKCGLQTLQARNSTNAPNEMTSASAIRIGYSSRNTVSPTAPTKRVRYQLKKSRPLSFSKCWHGSRHALHTSCALFCFCHWEENFRKVDSFGR